MISNDPQDLQPNHRHAKTLPAWTRIFIVDDNSAIRVMLRHIADELDVETLGEAGDGASAMEECGRLRPDVLLLDISMPGIGGFEVARHVVKHFPEIRIIFVSQNTGRVYAEEALHIGASGYVVKSAAYSELGAALRAVMAGEIFISGALEMRTAARPASD